MYYDEVNECACFMHLLVLVMWIYVAVRVYHSAEDHGMNAPAWAIAIFLTGLLTLLIFLIVRKGAANAMREKQMTRQPVWQGDHPGTTFVAGNYPQAGSVVPDPGFRDEHLDSLIEDGQLNDARKYLREMIQLAREMNDMEGMRNYVQYEARIGKASMSSTIRPRRFTDDR